MGLVSSYIVDPVLFLIWSAFWLSWLHNIVMTTLVFVDSCVTIHWYLTADLKLSFHIF